MALIPLRNNPEYANRGEKKFSRKEALRNQNKEAVEPQDEFAWSNTPGQIVGSTIKSPGLIGDLVEAAHGLIPQAALADESKLTPEHQERIKAYEQYGPQIHKPPTTSNIQENVIEPIGKVLPSVASKPQGLVQEALAMSAQNLPISIALGGVTGGASLFKDVLQSAAIKGTEKMGGGIGSQLLASLATGAGFNKAANVIKGFNASNAQSVAKGFKPGSLGDLGKIASEEFYKQEAKLGSLIREPVPKLLGKLGKLEEQVGRSYSLGPNKGKWEVGVKNLGEKQKQVVNVINEIKDDAFNGFISADKLSHHQREIGQLIGNSSGKEKSFYKAIYKDLMDEIGTVGAKNPEWHDTWKNASTVFRANNFNQQFADLARDDSKIGKYVSKGILSALFGTAGLGVGGPIGAATGATIGLGIQKAYQPIKFEAQRALKFLASGKETQKLYFKAVENFLKNNIPALTNDLARLSRLADKFEKSQGKSGEQRGMGKLIPLG